MPEFPPKPVSAPIGHWTPEQMIEVAARAVGKVCRDDVRGMTLLSVDEVAAMVGTLIALGLVPVLPGQPTPATLIRKED